MKAVQFDRYGDSRVLHMVDVESPQAGPGQVRIMVRTAGVNPVDWKIRSGAMAVRMPLSLPSGIGVDAAGVVDEVGRDITDVAVGDEVFGMGFATYAEFAVLDSWAPSRLTSAGRRRALSRSLRRLRSAISTGSASSVARPCSSAARPGVSGRP